MKNILFLTLFICSYPCYAYDQIDCFQQSPNLIKDGDKYYDFNALKLTNKEDEALRAFAKSIKGKWEGTLNEITCKGTDHSPKKVVTSGIAKVEYTSKSDDYLTLSMFVKSNKSGISRHNKLHLLPKDLITFLEVSKNNLNATKKHRQPVNYDSSRLVEINSKITLSKKQMTVDIMFFSNGYFAYSQRLLLHKK